MGRGDCCDSVMLAYSLFYSNGEKAVVKRVLSMVLKRMKREKEKKRKKRINIEGRRKEKKSEIGNRLVGLVMEMHTGIG